MSKDATIPVKFLLTGFNPDKRQWKPSTPSIMPVGDFIIQIDVPLQHDLIVNADKIISAQLSAGDVPDPIFTPAGMRYCIDKFEEVMSDPKPEEKKNGNGVIEDEGEEKEKWE
jgi:hypothetical protein